MDWVKVWRDVRPLTTIGRMLVFSESSRVLKVSVMVLRGGVTMDVDDARTTAGNVSMLETMSTTDDSSSNGDAVDVKMFSGGGIVSVLKSGIFDETASGEIVDVGSIATLLVNVLVTVMNLVLFPSSKSKL